MAAGIISLSSDFDLCSVIGGNTNKTNLKIPDFNKIILPKLESKLAGCGGGNEPNLVGRSCQWKLSADPRKNDSNMSWTLMPYPNGQNNEQCNTPLDACNYERQTWSDGGSQKYKNKLWDNFNYDMVMGTNKKGWYYYGGLDTISTTKNYNRPFYPTTKITNNTIGDFDDTTFNLANGFDNDVYTNEKIKLDTQISLVTDKTWGVRNYGWGDKRRTIPSRYSYYAYGKPYNLRSETTTLGYKDYMADMDVKHKVLKIADNDKKVQLDRYTKGQVYIFYKPNIDYVEIEIENNTGVKLTGNFWYFVTITGKENAVTANSGIKATVPYGHTDRTIIDDTIGFGASFGVKDTAGNINYSNYSHYLSGGRPRVGFPLNEIMKTHDSAAYAIRVTNKYDSSGTGYIIKGSIFEDTKEPTRANYTPKYKKHQTIKLEWS